MTAAGYRADEMERDNWARHIEMWGNLGGVG